MSKYDPLNAYLKRLPSDYVPMRFGDIENILGFKLPTSSRQHRAWWSNNADNNVMTKAWIEAGFETVSVDLGAEKLVFQRASHHLASAATPQPNEVPSSQAEHDMPPKRNPLFGALKGLLLIKSNESLMQGFDEDWNSDDH